MESATRYWQSRDSSYPFYFLRSILLSRSFGLHCLPQRRSKSSKVPREFRDWAWVEVEQDAAKLLAAVVCFWFLENIWIARLSSNAKVKRLKNYNWNRKVKRLQETIDILACKLILNRQCKVYAVLGLQGKSSKRRGERTLVSGLSQIKTWFLLTLSVHESLI